MHETYAELFLAYAPQYFVMLTRDELVEKLRLGSLDSRPARKMVTTAWKKLKQLHREHRERTRTNNPDGKKKSTMEVIRWAQNGEPSVGTLRCKTREGTGQLPIYVAEGWNKGTLTYKWYAI
jgi:hypothetical protein